MKAASLPLHRQLGLTDEEYSRIEAILGRSPNRTELAMYSVMWSEHCSYKSSRIHLRSLPSSGPSVLMGPGEGAGVVEVDGVAVAFRIESHNHPSFVEPHQGAATGVGGIIRDVLSVGARPIALLDPLRFGPLPNENRVEPLVAERNRYLLEGVVSGISAYGNSIGVPTVGGEVKFEDSYSSNPLVNVMCIGVAKRERIRRARAEGVGNAVLLLGSSTGRDGIGGVSVLASASFEDEGPDKRPSVQVGDPFTEKLLIEACLELMEKDLVTGVQDLGGAGLSCASSETAAAAGTGMRIDIKNVLRRETAMDPFEVLISESQERMLVIVRPDHVEEALGICDKWGLPASEIGVVTESRKLEVFDDGELVADVPAASLGDGPIYDRPRRRPEWLDALRAEKIGSEEPKDLRTVLLQIIASPNIASKRWVFEQYDHQVMLGTVVKPGHDAAVLRIEGTDKRIAVKCDGNGRLCTLDPYLGTMHAVAESVRNLAVVGARPIALTNCLNFGNPEREDVMWQFAESVRGLAEACTRLDIPVVGGNVSFYNETGGNPIDPTPVVGVIGVIEEEVTPPPVGFASETDMVVVLGETFEELGGSEYARTVERKRGGIPPKLDIEREAALSSVLVAAIEAGMLASAHDVSEGGLGVALSECCIQSHADLGASISVPVPDGDLPCHAWLFSESASRALVSLNPGRLTELEELAGRMGVPLAPLGMVGGNSLVVRFGKSRIEVGVSDLERAYEGALPAAMGASSEARGAL